MSSTTNIYLPLQFKQVVELVKTLPENEKQQLMDLLKKDEAIPVPEWQKQEVRKRIKKYKKNPEQLIDEKKALKMINSL